MHEPLTGLEIKLEANRCLNCYDAPCMNACPTHIDVASFIGKIATGNLRGSARVILDANAMGASCARVCPTEELCEGACVYKKDDTPIRIGDLQRYAIDWAMENDVEMFTAGPPTGRAVVGRAAGRVARAAGGRWPGLVRWRFAMGGGCLRSSSRGRFGPPTRKDSIGRVGPDC